MRHRPGRDMHILGREKGTAGGRPFFLGGGGAVSVALCSLIRYDDLLAVAAGIGQGGGRLFAAKNKMRRYRNGTARFYSGTCKHKRSFRSGRQEMSARLCAMIGPFFQFSPAPGTFCYFVRHNFSLPDTTARGTGYCLVGHTVPVSFPHRSTKIGKP